MYPSCRADSSLARSGYRKLAPGRTRTPDLLVRSSLVRRKLHLSRQAVSLLSPDRPSNPPWINAGPDDPPPNETNHRQMAAVKLDRPADIFLEFCNVSARAAASYLEGISGVDDQESGFRMGTALRKALFFPFLGFRPIFLPRYATCLRLCYRHILDRIVHPISFTRGLGAEGCDCR